MADVLKLAELLAGSNGSWAGISNWNLGWVGPVGRPFGAMGVCWEGLEAAASWAVPCRFVLAEEKHNGSKWPT